MCGIFVAFDSEGITSLNQSSMLEAIKKVKHRGPDNLDYFQDHICFLAHTRLSILDLDASSNQPFFYRDLVLVYNGELFNFQELRSELQDLNHQFSTESDTEVVAAAYDEWGTDSFERFNGMWSLALYDITNSELIISRDRFGQKPLFMSKQGGNILFASEFQQLSTFSKKDIDYGLIQMFLKEGSYEGDGRTFLCDIQEFPKAHYLKVSKSGLWESRPYWTYWHGEVLPTTDEAVKLFTDLLSDAVRLRLRSDVPFGLLLSGGVDSTLIGAYARQHFDKTKTIPAFTYSSLDGDDESFFAQVASERLNLSLHIHQQPEDPEEYIARLKTLVRHMGRGHSSPAIVSIDLLYESVSGHGVRVALDGQGADELLAGYKTYFMFVIPGYLKQRHFNQAWLVFKDQVRSGFILSLVLFLRNKLPSRLRKIMRLFYGYELLFKNYCWEVASRWIAVDPIPRNSNALNRHLIWQHNLGLENLLYYGDIVAMRNGVENRSPFMDHRLVEFAFQHDDQLKLKNAIDKYALRISETYQPFRDILDRKKIGFSSNILPKTKELMISELRQSKILDWPIFSKRMRKFVNSDKPMRPKFERFLFRLYQVHLWNFIFIDTKTNIR
jgi:asparagine synthase (glutamine-hydrolysing)